MMRAGILAKWMGSLLLCLWAAPMSAGTLNRHWGEIDGLRLSNATVVTRDGRQFRGHLVVTQTGVVVIHHGTYERWLATANSPEIPKALVTRILVRQRYRMTKEEQDDLWWYVAGDWKAIFYPELSNLFPIAIVAHAGFTVGAVLYTPVGLIAAACLPPKTDTIEILPD
ncbi:MAG: hypothetical protein ABSG96_02815 [Terracidiphilus sp.]|jgi:hypothetical protein